MPGRLSRATRARRPRSDTRPPRLHGETCEADPTTRSRRASLEKRATQGGDLVFRPQLVLLEIDDLALLCWGEIDVLAELTNSCLERTMAFFGQGEAFGRR